MLTRLLKKSSDTAPSYTQRRFFASNEKVFYGRLRRALPKCYVFPDIPLSKLLVPTSTDIKQKRGQVDLLVGRKVDFAVFDARLNLLFVIELGRPGGATETVTNAAMLASAGIKRFTWELDNLPSTDQTMRALAAYAAPAVAEGHEAPGEAAADVQAEQVVEQADVEAIVGEEVPVLSEVLHPKARNLTMATLAELAPQHALQTSYPHVWERITLFFNEPRHLNQYLISLSIQDRSVKRAGFSAEAAAEIRRIQVANAVFLQTAPVRASWNDVSTNR